MQPAFEVAGDADAWELPLVATAVHAGHELRPEIAARIALSDEIRFREEDPFTDSIAAVAAPTFVVHRSRFEVDLNRPRNGAVYTRPADAWGLEVWSRPLEDAVLQRSLRLYDDFYAAVQRALDDVAERGPFVVLDVHSYNDRRTPATGSGAPPMNPEVNVGTGSMDRTRWGSVVDRFIGDLRQVDVVGHRLDVRENVRFRGGHLAAWVHQRYATHGCALAVEFKKVFMDEWTGEVDVDHLEALGCALADAGRDVATSLAAVK
jgi:N-formylglutamate deformylase